MSRNKQRQRNKTATIERASPAMYGPQGIQGGPYAGRAGRNITIPASIVMQMLQSMAPQKNQAQDFAPGSPLAPYQGVVPLNGPRQFSYPVGFNLQAGTDRTLGSPDIPSFAQLRTFAATYDGIAICERAVLDLIPKLEPKVVLKKSVAEAGADENDYTASIKRWTAFIENPSPGQGLDIHSWLRMAWTEQTQLDALSIFKRKTRGGKLFGLEIISGDTIKPLLDERGMIPQPPYPAYQQYPYGVPGDMYTTEQMVYYRESPRATTPYGFSRVERIIMRVNQALRKQTKDLARFTEGNLPAGMMEVPDNSLWTPDQIESFEQAWNSLIAGNAQQQVRVKFTQPGMKYTEFADYINSEHMTEFDEFLLNVAVAVYGMSMGDLGFTEDIHKSSGDSQQNMMFRRTLAPFVAVYCRILTMLMCEAFGDTDLEVTMGGYEEAEDLQTQAAAYSQFATVGAISPSSIARLMKFPDIPETGPLLITKDGITPLANYEEGSEFRTASNDAQLAGLKLAAQPPQPAQDGQQQGNADENGQTNSPTKQPVKTAPVAKNGTPASESDAPTKADIKRLQEQIEELLRVQRASLQGGHFVTQPQEDTERASGNDTDTPGGDSEVATRQATTGVTQSVAQGVDLQTRTDGLLDTLRQWRTEDDLSSKAFYGELKRWRTTALHDLRDGRAFRGFTTVILPEVIHTGISRSLVRCSTPEHVRMVFERADAMTEPTLIYDPVHDIWTGDDVEHRLQHLRDTGVESVQWKTYAGTCDQCARNANQVVATGGRFDTGHQLPPTHPNCECTAVPVPSMEGVKA